MDSGSLLLDVEILVVGPLIQSSRTWAGCVVSLFRLVTIDCFGYRLYWIVAWSRRGRQRDTKTALSLEMCRQDSAALLCQWRHLHQAWPSSCSNGGFDPFSFLITQIALLMLSKSYACLWVQTDKINYPNFLALAVNCISYMYISGFAIASRLYEGK